MLTIALSGPADTRAQAEVALEDARIPVYPTSGPCPCGCPAVGPLGQPAGHHAVMDWRTKFPDEDCAWLTVEHKDVNHVVSVVEKAEGWRLRMHYETPAPPAPDPLTATLAEMRAEIDALKAGRS